MLDDELPTPVEVDRDFLMRMGFIFYQWCPRTPTEKIDVAHHQARFLFHRFFEGQFTCVDFETMLMIDELQRKDKEARR